MRGCLKIRTKFKNPKISFLIGGEYFSANLEYQKDFSAWQFLFSKMSDLELPFENLLLAVQSGARLNRAGEIDLTYCKADLDLQNEFDSIPTELLEQAAEMVVLDKTLKKSDSTKILRQIKKLDTPEKNLGIEKNSVSDETKDEEIRAGIQSNTPIIYCGAIPEKFEIGLIEINRCAMNCEYYGLKKFFKVYGFTEIEIYALRTGYDFENHELIFPLSENIFDKELEEKIECCKIKFKANDFEPLDYRSAGVVVRYVQWFLGTYDIVNKFKIDDEKKFEIVDGKKRYGLMKYVFNW